MSKSEQHYVSGVIKPSELNISVLKELLNFFGTEEVCRTLLSLLSDEERAEMIEYFSDYGDVWVKSLFFKGNRKDEIG